MIWKKRKLNVKTYHPEKRLDLRKEHALPFFSYVGLKISELGGGISLFTHAFFASAFGFFHVKSKIRQVQMSREKVLDLRKDRPQKLRF